jgi:hypothetical protein
MLNGFATLPKRASEIKDGSNAPVSGDAVHDYVEANKITIANSVASGNPNTVSSGAVYSAIQAIPSSAPLTVGTYNDLEMWTHADWQYQTVSSQIIFFGQIIQMKMVFKTLYPVTLTHDKSLTEMWPLRYGPHLMTLCPFRCEDVLIDSGYGPLTLRIEKGGTILICRQSNNETPITIPIGTTFTGTATYIKLQE